MDNFEDFLKDETVADVIAGHDSQILEDPLEAGSEIKVGADQSAEKIKTNLNEIVDAVLQRIKNAKEIVCGLPETCEAGFMTKQQSRKPKSGETLEQQERRLMRQRILQMKNRLLLQLEVPDKAQAEKERATVRARLKRQRRKAKETPAEAEARKRRQRLIVATSRKRLKELETPEQQAERIAKQNEKKKLKNQEISAKETPEQRAARKNRERSYREKYKQHKLAMKTGKIRGQKLQG